jgi:hypothetical protein
MIIYIYLLHYHIFLVKPTETHKIMPITKEQLEQLRFCVDFKSERKRVGQHNFQQLVAAFNSSTSDELTSVSSSLWGDAYVSGSAKLVRDALLEIIRNGCKRIVG